MYISSTNGPTFGIGKDFAITNNCLKYESTCNSSVSFSNVKTINEFNEEESIFIANEVEVLLVEQLK